MERGLDDGGRAPVLFNRSAQGTTLYQIRNRMRDTNGRDPSWEEILAEAKARKVKALPAFSIFDPFLCELLYRWFCPPSGQVLDPFAGGAVRGLVAQSLGLRYTGIDLSARQIRANRRLAKRWGTNPRWLIGDSRQLDRLVCRPFDFLFSCPPYADLERYSDNPRDLSAMRYGQFREAYTEIIGKAVALLRVDRFAGWVIGDVRAPSGFYRGLVTSTIQAFEKAEARLYNQAVLLNVVGSAAVRARGMFRTRKLCTVHQHVLIFCKGDPKRAAEACFGAKPDVLETS